MKTTFRLIVFVLAFALLFTCLFTGCRKKEKPKLSSMTEEECRQFIADKGIELPEEFRDREVRKLIEQYENHPEDYYYSNPEDPTFYSKYVWMAVLEYYGITNEKYEKELEIQKKIAEKPKLSSMTEEECRQFLAEKGVAIPAELGEDYNVKWLIAHYEEYPEIEIVASYTPAHVLYESVWMAVLEYYGITNEAYEQLLKYRQGSD